MLMFPFRSGCDSSLIYTDGFDASETAGLCFVQDVETTTYHYDRSRQLCLSDPVHTIELHKFVQSQVSDDAIPADVADTNHVDCIAQLDTMAGQLGAERFQSMVASIGEQVLVQLRVFLRI